MRSMVVVNRYDVDLVLMLHRLENVLVRGACFFFDKSMLLVIEDINECAQKPSPCKAGERCDNTAGSYRCVQTFACANGLEMKDLQCLGRIYPTVPRPLHSFLSLCLLDIDECAIGNHTCLPPATCKNTYGSFYVR